MEEIIDKLLLKDKIEFNGSVDELNQRINQRKGRKFNVEWISDNEFKFLSKWSIGTLMVDGAGMVDGIKGYAKIHLNEGKK